MARYKDYSYEQSKLLPIRYSEQILPATFEHTLHHLIDELDLSIFDARFEGTERHKVRARNDNATPRLFRPEDFLCDEAKRTCLCPAGKHLYKRTGPTSRSGASRA